MPTPGRGGKDDPKMIGDDIMKLDANSDGKLSKEEFKKG